MSPPSVALFDLDGTLLAHDTQLLFCNYVLQRHPLRRLFLPLAALFAPAGLARVLDARELKRVFLSYLWLMPRDRVLEYAADFARTIIPPLIYSELESEIARHRKEGRVLILNSASPEFYVQEIGKVLGFDVSYGTQIVLEALQPLIAEIQGENNKREAKLPRMAEYFPCAYEDSWAYSDSPADFPMLKAVKNVVVVNPESFLATQASRHQWTVLRPPRPWNSRAGQACTMLRQVLGLWNA